MVVRSRIFHTIWCLYKTSLHPNLPNGERNIGDYKYFQNIKDRPLQNNNLLEICNDSDVASILGGPNSLILSIINHLQANTIYRGISNFQKNCAINTLKKLHDRKKADGIVFVAGTGSGKSFAYQLPFLLWILSKKIKKWEEHMRGGNRDVN